MDVDKLYCTCISTDESVALVVQRDIALTLRDFTKKTAHMDAALARLRHLFFAAFGIDDPDDMAHMRAMMGITPTASALGIHPRMAMSPSPKDTRIAFVIGKNSTKDGKPHLEVMYAVCLRVEDLSRVYLSKVITCSERNVAKEATGGTPCKFVTLEAELVALPVNCCKEVVENGTRAITTAVKAVHRVTAESFESLVDSLVVALGRNTLEPLELKRMHSSSPPVLTRTDSVAVHKCTLKLKTALKRKIEEVSREEA
jgi:hypothetical protein